MRDGAAARPAPSAGADWYLPDGHPASPPHPAGDAARQHPGQGPAAPAPYGGPPAPPPAWGPPQAGGSPWAPPAAESPVDWFGDDPRMDESPGVPVWPLPPVPPARESADGPPPLAAPHDVTAEKTIPFRAPAPGAPGPTQPGEYGGAPAWAPRGDQAPGHTPSGPGFGTESPWGAQPAEGATGVATPPGGMPASPGPSAHPGPGGASPAPDTAGQGFGAESPWGRPAYGQDAREAATQAAPGHPAFPPGVPAARPGEVPWGPGDAGHGGPHATGGEGTSGAPGGPAGPDARTPHDPFAGPPPAPGHAPGHAPGPAAPDRPALGQAWPQSPEGGDLAGPSGYGVHGAPGHAPVPAAAPGGPGAAAGPGSPWGPGPAQGSQDGPHAAPATGDSRTSGPGGPGQPVAPGGFAGTAGQGASVSTDPAARPGFEGGPARDHRAPGDAGQAAQAAGPGQAAPPAAPAHGDDSPWAPPRPAAQGAADGAPGDGRTGDTPGGASAPGRQDTAFAGPAPTGAGAHATPGSPWAPPAAHGQEPPGEPAAGTTARAGAFPYRSPDPAGQGDSAWAPQEGRPTASEALVGSTPTRDGAQATGPDHGQNTPVGPDRDQGANPGRPAAGGAVQGAPGTGQAASSPGQGAPGTAQAAPGTGQENPDGAQGGPSGEPSGPHQQVHPSAAHAVPPADAARGGGERPRDAQNPEQGTPEENASGKLPKREKSGGVQQHHVPQPPSGDQTRQLPVSGPGQNPADQPGQNTPNQGAAGPTTPSQGIPLQNTPAQTGQNPAVPAQTGQTPAVPGQNGPSQDAPGQTGPGKSGPGNNGAGQGAPVAAERDAFTPPSAEPPPLPAPAEPETPKKGRKKVLIGVAAVAGLALVAAGGFFGYRALDDGRTSTASRPIPSNKPLPEVPGNQQPRTDTSRINSVKTDPKLMGVGEAFPSDEITLSGKKFTRVQTKLDADCSKAAVGPFANALRKQKCQRVVRATFVDSEKKYAITTGVAVMPTREAAVAADKAKNLKNNLWFRGLPGPKSSAATKVHVAGGYAAGLVWGRYIVFSYATYADGHTPAKDEKDLAPVSDAFRDYAVIPIEKRATA
ncbi:hypothetical protein D5H75_32085 [Bailinhaonella thermotolerans]|uniref:Uncharacterized protein n=2 Tax=Bailinhaonella thermotolerans TaxID=1070861 RepID=A0A3A4AQG6_9ACTN|nr:hypothetical protein D5H75_32085 [Bailinhaonella thermotolerans]